MPLPRSVPVTWLPWPASSCHRSRSSWRALNSGAKLAPQMLRRPVPMSRWRMFSPVSMTPTGTDAPTASRERRSVHVVRAQRVRAHDRHGRVERCAHGADRLDGHDEVRFRDGGERTRGNARDRRADVRVVPAYDGAEFGQRAPPTPVPVVRHESDEDVDVGARLPVGRRRELQVAGRCGDCGYPRQPRDRFQPGAVAWDARPRGIGGGAEQLRARCAQRGEKRVDVRAGRDADPPERPVAPGGLGLAREGCHPSPVCQPLRRPPGLLRVVVRRGHGRDAHPSRGGGVAEAFGRTRRPRTPGRRRRFESGRCQGRGNRRLHLLGGRACRRLDADRATFAPVVVVPHAVGVDATCRSVVHRQEPHPTDGGSDREARASECQKSTSPSLSRCPAMTALPFAHRSIPDVDCANHSTRTSCPVYLRIISLRAIIRSIIRLDFLFHNDDSKCCESKRKHIRSCSA